MPSVSFKLNIRLKINPDHQLIIDRAKSSTMWLTQAALIDGVSSELCIAIKPALFSLITSTFIFTSSIDFLLHWTAMQSRLALVVILMVGLLHQAYTQNWVGRFRPGTCDQRRCCCITGPVTITKGLFNLYSISASRLSAATCFGQSTASLAIPDPNGYQATFGFLGLSVTVKLTRNSRMISLSTSQGPTCKVNLTRI